MHPQIMQEGIYLWEYFQVLIIASVCSLILCIDLKILIGSMRVLQIQDFKNGRWYKPDY